MKGLFPSPRNLRTFILEVYTLHYEKLHFYAASLCYQYNHPILLAEDLVMDVFTKALEGRLKIHTNCPEKVLPLFYSKVRRNLTDEYRKKESIQKCNTKFIEKHDISLVSELYDQCALLSIQNLFEEISQYLPAELDQQLILAFLHGYSYKEMARQFDLSSNTIASKIHRIKRILRQQLQADRYERISPTISTMQTE